jgi:hypothetical protein
MSAPCAPHTHARHHHTPPPLNGLCLPHPLVRAPTPPPTHPHTHTHTHTHTHHTHARARTQQTLIKANGQTSLTPTARLLGLPLVNLSRGNCLQTDSVAVVVDAGRPANMAQQALMVRA